LLGKALAERGAYKEAIPYYCKALALELKDQLAAVHTDLGDAYRKDDEKAKAVESYQRALQLDRKNANIYRQLALLLTEAREFNQAVQVFQAAVEADPEFGYIFEDLVKELRLQGAHEVASEICHLSLAVESGNSSFFFRLGYVSGDLKDDKNAVDAYEKSARLNPNEPATYNNWGVALGNLGRHAEALEKYQRAVELNPSYAWAYGNWGWSLGALERHAEALEKCQRAVELNPSYAWAYDNWGRSLDHLERHAEALEKYEKAGELNPSQRPPAKPKA
jgi:superkiller protein 3